MRRNLAIVSLVGILVAGCGSPQPTADQVADFARAKSLYLQGEWRQSRAVLEGLLAKNDQFAAAEFLSAKVAFMTGDWALAERRLTTLVNRDPGHADARLWLCRTFLAESKVEGLEPHLGWLLAHDSENPQVSLLAAAVAEVKGQYQDALEHYRIALLFRDEIGKGLLETARIYKRSLQKDRALEQAREALAVLGKDSYLAKPTADLIAELGR